jgi:hypothetical protein
MTLTHSSNLKPIYVKLENAGLTFKPLPTIIFYSDRALDTLEIPYGQSFRVKESELELIEEIVRQNISQSKSDTQEVYYKFSIIKGQEKFTNSATRISTVKNIFNLICNQISDDKLRKSVRDNLDYIAGRLSF